MAAEPNGIDTYDAWRARFATERLRVLYIVGLIANPAFALLDILVYPDALRALTFIRVILELGLLAGFLGLKQQLVHVRPTTLLAFWILWPNMLVVHMTLLIGGFSSQYYNGLSLVLLAAAVIVPVSWRSHLTAQVGTLLYYYAANLVSQAGRINVQDMIQNSFFLVWTCVALIISVTLYEQLQRAEFDARQAEGRARRELEASNQKLLELDRLKSEFFANISHELRTPLTLILGAYKSLLKLAPTTDGQELIQTGVNNATRLLVLINQLLDLAKFDSGRALLAKRCIDFTRLVRSVAANFESSERYRIHFEQLTDPLPVECDAKQMKTVLYNLLSNAFKFSDPVAGRAWLRLRTSEDWIELDVEDNGIGIPEAQMDRIFERFTQVEGSATRQYEGTGIGLALVKEILSLHGGRVQVKSRLGVGSTFTLTLPRGAWDGMELASLEEDDMAVPARRPERGLSDTASTARTTDRLADGTAPLVLVAEDNDDMRAYVERVLAPHCRIIQARDGAEAFELATRHQPELILTDAMMPRMSGDALLNAIRSDEALKTTPVIFLTARAGTDARVESLQGGADDYVTKPFEERELIARVTNLLRARDQDRRIDRLHQQLVASQTATIDHLKEMDRLKSQFLAHVSHELRTPLTSIGGFVENMARGIAGPVSERQHEYLTRLKANCARLNRMISDLLDRARQEAGKLSVTMTDVNLMTAVAEVTEQLQPLATAKQQRLIFERTEHELRVSADPDRVHQIVTNLVDNAIKYTPAGGTVTVQVAPHGTESAEVSVRDTGEGIPPDALPRLFDPFYRATRHERSPVKGLGLGLSIVKQLIELHGGTIAVESTVGNGTVFQVVLPLLHGAHASQGPPPQARRTILIVDDDADIRRLIADRLTADGHTVQTAATGPDGLGALQQGRFDGVFLDLGLPQVSGLDVLHEVRRLTPTLPVVIMTASGSRERAVHALEAGAQAYLLKPFDETALTEAVHRWF